MSCNNKRSVHNQNSKTKALPDGRRWSFFFCSPRSYSIRISISIYTIAHTPVLPPFLYNPTHNGAWTIYSSTVVSIQRSFLHRQWPSTLSQLPLTTILLPHTSNDKGVTVSVISVVQQSLLQFLSFDYAVVAWPLSIVHQNVKRCTGRHISRSASTLRANFPACTKPPWAIPMRTLPNAFENLRPPTRTFSDGPASRHCS